jgi:hypothetical protein
VFEVRRSAACAVEVTQEALQNISFNDTYVPCGLGAGRGGAVACVRGGRACDVCATARSSQQLQGHGPGGPEPRSGSAVLCGPIKAGVCVWS